MIENALKENYQNILKKIHCAQKKSPFQQLVTLLAVSKAQSIDSIRTLYSLGQKNFAENYAQELILKARTLQHSCLDLQWHFIGPLQRNKVKSVLPWIQSLHSLSSLTLAEALQAQLISLKRSLSVFIQINLHLEKTKSGIDLQELPHFLLQLKSFSQLNIEGLMCIPDPEACPRTTFQTLKHLAQSHSLKAVSMGMSQDYSIAIEAGATHIRIGTALFGTRKKL